MLLIRATIVGSLELSEVRFATIVFTCTMRESRSFTSDISASFLPGANVVPVAGFASVVGEPFVVNWPVRGI